MLVVLLLELCFEFLFLFVRCFADQTVLSPPGRGEARAVDITYRGYVFVRGMYAIVVLIINCCVYWIGGGPNGACMFYFAFFLLVFPGNVAKTS